MWKLGSESLLLHFKGLSGNTDEYVWKKKNNPTFVKVSQKLKIKHLKWFHLELALTDPQECRKQEYTYVFQIIYMKSHTMLRSKILTAFKF